jgi:predicted PurR-regulated permease PerM
VLRNVFSAAHRVLGWGVACMVIAIMLKPPIEWLSRFLPKVVALLLVGLGIAGLSGVLVYGVFDDLQSETATLQRRAPAAAARLEQRDDRVGEISRDLRLAERAQDAFEGLEQRFGIDNQAIASAAGTVPSYFVCFILTIFFVLYGPRVMQGAADQITDARRRRRLERLFGGGLGRARGYLWYALLQGAVVGVLVFSFAEAFELPAEIVLALIAAVAATVPYIGIVVGLIPTVLMAAGLEEPLVGVALLTVGIGAQAVEAVFIRRVVDGRTLHVGPAIPVIVGSIGLEVYGIGGALYGAAIAVLALAFADAAATDADEPLPTPNQDWTEEPPADLGEESEGEPAAQAEGAPAPPSGAPEPTAPAGGGSRSARSRVRP